MKRKGQNEDDPKWWEAVHKAQDWDEAGLSHRKIADRLNKEGYQIGRGRTSLGWTDTAVTRALDRHPKVELVYPIKWPGEHPLLDLNGTVEIETGDRDGGPRTRIGGTAYHPGEFDSEADYQRFKEEVTRRGTIPFDPDESFGDFQERARKLRAYPVLKPRDWSVGAEHDAWVNTWRVSEEGWDKGIVPMVIRQMQATGKNTLALLDGIEVTAGASPCSGHAAERGQLRRVYLGLIRRLCMREETVLALKEEIEKLRGNRPA